MKLIGVFGGLNSGKDTAAGFLQKELSYTVLSLAAPMKVFLGEILGFSREQLWGESEQREVSDQRWGVTPRHALQTLGTGWCREMIHPDVWISYALDAIRNKYSELDVVVPDLRFQNEVDRFREFGGKIVKVVRPGKKKSKLMGHVSEQGPLLIDDSNFDAIITNNGTVDELRDKILEFEKTVTNRSI